MDSGEQAKAVDDHTAEDVRPDLSPLSILSGRPSLVSVALLLMIPALVGDEREHSEG